MLAPVLEALALSKRSGRSELAKRLLFYLLTEKKSPGSHHHPPKLFKRAGKQHFSMLNTRLHWDGAAGLDTTNYPSKNHHQMSPACAHSQNWRKE